MKANQLQKALILVSVACGALAGGCELIVDFDRTKIPIEAVDAAVAIDAAGLGPTDEGGTTTEAGADGASKADGATEAGPKDAAADAPKDAATDG